MVEDETLAHALMAHGVVAHSGADWNSFLEPPVRTYLDSVDA